MHTNKAFIRVEMLIIRFAYRLLFATAAFLFLILFTTLLISPLKVNAQGTQPSMVNGMDKLMMSVYGGTVTYPPGSPTYSDGHHICVVTVAWGIKCWGLNVYGQATTGSNSPLTQTTPYQTPYSGGIKQIVSGLDHSCVLKTDGSVECWGYNNDCQLGNNGYATPAQCQQTYSYTPVQPVGLGAGSTKALAAGYDHTCAIKSDDSLWCWGYNLYGQIGDGTNGVANNKLSPTAVSGFGAGTTKAVVAGAWHTCAIKSDDTMSCWGNNAYGQLGINSRVNQSLPVLINSTYLPGGVSSMGANRYITCAVLLDGSGRCWGINSEAIGIVGDGTTGSDRLVPVALAGGLNAAGSVVAISVGYNHACAIVTSPAGTLKCWGFGSNGQLFTGNANSYNYPFASSGISNVNGVTAGTYGTCALTTLGEIYCTGSNIYGQNGNGLTASYITTPYNSMSAGTAWMPDSTPPTLSANNTNTSASWSSAQINATVTATDSGSGLAWVKYSYVSAANCTASGTATANAAVLTPAAGSQTLYLCAQDSAGNAAAWWGTYYWDNTAPTAPNAMTSANIVGGYVSGSFTANAPSGGTDPAPGTSGIKWYNLCASADNTTGCSITVASGVTTGTTLVSGSNLPASGSYKNYYWYAVDSATPTANSGALSTATQVTMDSTAPVLNTKTTFSGWYNANQTSTFTYTDAGSGIASGNPATCIISTEGSNQTCSVTPNVCDVAGNCNTTLVTSNGANIDKTAPTAPTLICSGYTSGVWQSANPATTCAITDTATPSPRTAVAYSINGGTSWVDNANSLSFGFTPTANTTTNVIMRISDTGGGPTNSNTFVIMIDTTPPTAPTLNCTNYTSGVWQSTNPATTCSINDTATISPRTAVAYSINGGTSWVDNANALSFGFTPTANVITNVIMRISDSGGGPVNSNTFVIMVDNAAPTAPVLTCTNYTSNVWQSTNPATTCTITDTAAPSPRTAVAYSTDGGGSWTANGVLLSFGFTPTVNATTNVIMRISDSGGGPTNSNTFIIMVDNAAPPAPTLTCTNYTSGVWQGTNPATTCSINDTATPSPRTAVAYSINGGTSWVDNTNALSFGFTPTANQITNVIMRISDSGGGPTNSNTFVIMVDNAAPAAPVLTCTNYANNVWQNTNPATTCTITDTATPSTRTAVGYSTDGGSSWTANGILLSFGFTPAANATTNVIMRISDFGGGPTSSNTYVIKEDGVAPAYSSKTTFSGWYNTNQTSTFTYTDATSGIASGTPVTCIISTEGSNQTCNVTPNVCDAAGNCNTTSQTSNGANIDKTAPTAPVLTCTNYTNNVWQSANPATTCTITDTATPSPRTATAYSTNGGTSWTDNLNALSFGFTPAANATTNVIMRISDSGGGPTSSNTYVIKVDNVAPVFSSKTSFSGWYNANQTSTFTYTDATSGIASGTPVTCIISTEGSNQTCSVTPNVCDGAGNCNTTGQTSNGANIDKTAPTAPVLTCTNYTSGVWSNTNPATTCSITDTATPSPRTAVAYSTNGGGSWVDNANALSFGFTPTANTTTNVIMRISDSGGGPTSSNTYVIMVDIAAPPAPTLTCTNYANGVWQNTNPATTCSINDTATPSTRTAVAYSTNGGGSWVDNANALSFGFTPTANASTSVIMRISDSGGGPTNSNTYVLDVDTLAPTAPVLTCTNYTSGVWSSTNPATTCSITDTATPSPRTLVSYSTNGGGSWTANGTTLSFGFTPTANTTTNVIMRISDTGGGPTNSNTYVIMVDTAAPPAPTLTCTNYTNNVWLNANPATTCSINDTATPSARTAVAYTINGGTSWVDNANALTFGFTPTANATTNVIMRISDSGGGPTSSNTYIIKNDLVAPAYSSKTTFSGWYTANQTSTFTYADATSGIISGTPVTCIISTEGVGQTCSVTPNVCDAAGNCNTTGQTSNGANIDKTAPTAPVLTCTNYTSGVWSSSNPATTCSITDTATPSPRTAVAYTINGGTSWVDNANALSFGFTPTANTTTNVIMRISDSGGGPTNSNTYVIMNDIAAPLAPVLSCTGYVSGTWQIANPATTCTITDTATPSPRTAVDYSTDGGGSWTANGTLLSFGFTPTANATTNVIMRISDSGGGPTNSNTFVIRVDNAAPAGSTVNDGPKAEENNITYTATYNDAGVGGVTMAWDTTSATCTSLGSYSATMTQVWILHDAGTKTVSYKVRDSLGNITGCLTNTATWTNTLPTAAAGSDSPKNENQTLTFTAAGSTDPGGTTFTYQWYTDSGCTTTAPSGTSVTLPILQTEPVTLTYYVKVTDINGGVSANCASATGIWNNVAPTALAVTGTAAENNTITFNANVSDPGGTTFSYQWYTDVTCATPISLATLSSYTTPVELEPIIKTFYYKGFDAQAVGTTCQTATGTWTNVAPTAIISSDTPQNENGTITFTALASTDPGGTTFSYQWYTDSGCSSSIGGATGVTRAETLAEPGIVSRYAIVKDAQSVSSACVGSVGTFINVAPTSFNVSNSGFTNSTIVLTANATDPGGTTFTYKWYTGSTCSSQIGGQTGVTYTAPAQSTPQTIVYSYVATDASTVDSICSTATATWNLAANNTPSLASLSLNGGAAINLTGGGTRATSATATVTDLDGYADISTVTAKIYRSGVGPSCTVDNNNCYSVSCVQSGCSGTSCTSTCTVNITYYAEPTDTGTYSAENWLATLTATDTQLATATATSAGVEMNSLKSFTNTGAINFGTLNPNSNSGATNQTVVTTNNGNVALTMMLDGSDLCNGSCIPVGNTRYLASAFTYPGASVVLTTTSTLTTLSIPKSTNGTAPTGTLYFGQAIPSGTSAKAYSGNINLLSN